MPDTKLTFGRIPLRQNAPSDWSHEMPCRIVIRAHLDEAAERQSQPFEGGEPGVVMIVEREGREGR